MISSEACTRLASCLVGGTRRDRAAGRPVVDVARDLDVPHVAGDLDQHGTGAAAARVNGPATRVNGPAARVNRAGKGAAVERRRGCGFGWYGGALVFKTGPGAWFWRKRRSSVFDHGFRPRF